MMKPSEICKKFGMKNVHTVSKSLSIPETLMYKYFAKKSKLAVAIVLGCSVLDGRLKLFNNFNEPVEINMEEIL